MFEYIQDAGLKPARAQTKRAKTNLIVLHHVEGNMTPQQIHQMHINKGYSGGIAYNIYIGKDGAVYWGRGLEAVGGGVKNSGVSAGVNARCVAIVCNGNFMKEQMPPAQLAALKRVTLDVARYYDLAVDQIKGHREVGNSDCPGKYYPLDEVRAYIRQNLKGGGSNVYQTKEPTPVYKKERTISAGVKLELQSYTGGEYARVKNPETANEFIVPFANLKQI